MPRLFARFQPASWFFIVFKRLRALRNSQQRAFSQMTKILTCSECPFCHLFRYKPCKTMPNFSDPLGTGTSKVCRGLTRALKTWNIPGIEPLYIPWWLHQDLYKQELVPSRDGDCVHHMAIIFNMDWNKWAKYGRLNAKNVIGYSEFAIGLWRIHGVVNVDQIPCLDTGVCRLVLLPCWQRLPWAADQSGWTWWDRRIAHPKTEFS